MRAFLETVSDLTLRGSDELPCSVLGGEEDSWTAHDTARYARVVTIGTVYAKLPAP